MDSERSDLHESGDDKWWLIKSFARLILLGVFGWLLFGAKQCLVARVADWVSIVSIVGGFYLAVCEPKVLAWLIERVTRFIELIRTGKTQRKRRRFSWLSNLFKNESRSTKIEPNTLVKKSDAGSRLPVLFALLLLVILLIAAWVNRSERLPKEKVPPSPTAEPEKISDTRQPNETGDQRYTKYVINQGDRCYTMAKRCTGDGERFIELGSPVNPDLDVSDRKLCLLEVDQVLNIPESWPRGCLESN